MNLNEKIQKLRKDNNLSQEQLAEKLNVSRQSVSKWESGSSYPEMEKLLQMCKIFNISLEDLTNEKSVIENSSKKEKKPVNEFVNSFQELINKSIKMLSLMNTKDIIKMIIVLCLICLGISLIRIPINYIMHIGFNLFDSFGNTVGNVFSQIWNFILEAVYIILGFMILFFVYKNVYLDKFDEKKIEPKEAEKKEEEKPEIIIQKHEYPVLDTLGKIILIILKIFAVFFALPFMGVFIGFMIMLAIMIWLIIKGIFFFGPLTLLLAGIFAISMLLEVVFSFVANKKLYIKKIFIEFILALSLFGIGIGATMIEVTDYKFINEVPENYELVNKTETIKFNKDLVLFDRYNLKYIIDESLKNSVKIEVNYYDGLSTPKIEVKNNTIQIWSMDDEFNFDAFNNILNNLKDKKVYNYFKLSEYNIKIYTSSNNISIMKQNILNQQNQDYYQQTTYYEDKISELESIIETLREEKVNAKEEIEEYKNKLQEYKKKVSDLLQE